MTEPVRYRPGVEGWVVEDRRDMPMKDGTTREHVTYWFGPDHGWGNTWASRLGSSIRVWPTLDAAFQAARSAGVVARTGVTIRPLSEVEEELGETHR
jgi:hypothetical protein